MTSREKRLVLDSWRRFCRQNPDYSVILFMGMFTRHPEYQKLFRPFRKVHREALPSNAKFRAHACAVGHQLSAIVESLDEPEVAVELIRKNAADHTKRARVRPANFEGLFSAVLAEMEAKSKPVMTPAVVAAWEKLFRRINIITRSVYDQADATASGSATVQSGTPSLHEEHPAQARDAAHSEAGAKLVDAEEDSTKGSTKSETPLKHKSSSLVETSPVIRSVIPSPEMTSTSARLPTTSTEATKRD
ncbi:hypothetical protein HPB48_008095 [Haemaphysalis longicornis]|uniref:Globin domain-containing protein n=1 Tax=Haemaphysalis longicornis TaxID=44386 RepID=A0A9J6GY92_HAELO|nr:hypothetical protein HPB48_008095 [Haemaphysalis longicornis]